MFANHSSSAARAGAGPGHSVVLCQVGAIICALPLEHVSETLRPLPVEALARTAPFIDGISIIRGAPIPVVDLARLLGNASTEPRARLVLVKVGERRVALAVTRVIGVRYLEAAALIELPPVLTRASSEVISAIGSLDARLLVLLEASRVVPDSTWAILEGAGA